ncbi:MAG: hypothetical protein ACYTEV_10300 [Planctomycetota bacterium]|jgi:hypothetical protein
MPLPGPVRLLAAALLGGALTATAAAAGTSFQDPGLDPLAAGLPDGRAVLERAVEAMGGREAFERVRSLTADLVIGMPGGELEMEARSIDPDRLSLRLKATLERPVEARMLKHGTVAWMTMQSLDSELQPLGEPTLLPQIPTADLKRFGAAVRAHWMVLRLLEDYASMQSVAIEPFQEQPALKVRVTEPRTPRGRAAAEGERFLFVSLADGMPLGIDAPTGAADGSRQVLEFKEPQTFGDLRLWTRMVGTNGPVQQSFIFRSISFNDVPEDLFAIPPAVAAREAARAAESPATPGGSSESGGRP